MESPTVLGAVAFVIFTLSNLIAALVKQRLDDKKANGFHREDHDLLRESNKINREMLIESRKHWEIFREHVTTMDRVCVMKNEGQ